MDGWRDLRKGMQPLELKKAKQGDLLRPVTLKNTTKKKDRKVRRRKDEEKLKRSHRKKAIVALKGWIHLQHTRIAAAFALCSFLLFLGLKVINNSSRQMRKLNAYVGFYIATFYVFERTAWRKWSIKRKYFKKSS